jgi:uncharacterized protein YwbE
MADLLPVHKTGAGADLQYFRTSDVYGESGGIGVKVGITKMKDAELTGKETIVPVKELLRTSDLFRIGIKYKNTAGKSKTAKILVSRDLMSKLFGTTPAEKLEGTPYKIGAAAAKGNINGIHGLRRATTY